ncbi:MAG: acyltransferase family protein, partial [Burkholderiales bacterium]
MRNGLPSRIAEIEGIRGIMTLLVVAQHMMHGGPLFWVWGCMDIFFCISGFVITRILLENLTRPGFLKNYFIRRVLRIWPMYYVAMMFAFAVFYLTDGSTLQDFGLSNAADWQPSWQALVFPLVYLQNTEVYSGSEPFNYLILFIHSWSVAVEEHFYLLWPFVLLFLLRGRSTS